MPEAARLGDEIGHSHAMSGLLWGLAAGAVIGAAIILTGGLAIGPIAGAIAVTAGAGQVGEALGGMSMFGVDKSGAISSGSPNVFINKKPAARAHLSLVLCSKHPPPDLVAQGSSGVYINGQPAARKGDGIVCGGKISKGSGDVIIGGGTQTTDAMNPEVPVWVNQTLKWVGLVAGVVAVGPVVFAIAYVGGEVGGEIGGAVGGAMFGEGSDGQKLMAMGGSLVGAMLAGGAAAGSEASGEVAGETASETAAETAGESAAESSAEAAEGESSARTPEQDANANKVCERDPVDVISGQVRFETVDFTLPGVLPVVFQRSYESDFSEVGALGPKWRCTWSAMVLETRDHEAAYVTADGLKLYFNLRGGRDVGGWISNPLAPKIKLRRAASGYEVRERDRTTLIFEFRQGDSWLVSEISHPNGYAIQITRARDGAINLVEHSGGYRLHVAGAPHAIETISLELANGSREPLVSYQYDSNGYLVGIVNGSGLPLRYEYDERGRVTKWIDREGTWYTYSYDEDGRVCEVDGSAHVLRGRFHYDRARHTTTVEDAQGNTRSYVYDDTHHVVEERDALGGVRRMRWNLAGQKTAETDANGQLTRYEYDHRGNLIALIDATSRKFQYSYDRNDLPTQFEDAEGRRWLRVYDERGNLLSAGLEGKTPWRYERDFAGNLTAVIDPEGQRREYVCDSRGLPVAVTDALGHRTQYQRDDFGRVVRETNALGGVTRFAYNELHKLSAVGLPDGAAIQWEYNPEGLVTRRVAQDGTEYRYHYGAFDKLAQIEKPSGGRFRFAYDLEARVQAVENERGEAYRYTYDALGRVVEETDFSGRKLRYEYDAAGFCIKRTNGKGEWTTYLRDPLGRVTAKLHSDGGKETFAYDANGALAEAANGSTTVRFERDEYGRVVREEQGEHWVASSYDAAGRRRQRRTSFGTESAWRYDPNGQVAALQLPDNQELLFTRDELGRETARQFGPDFLLRQSYDVMSRLTEQAGGDDIRRRFRYDVMSNPVEIADRQWGSSHFGYNEDGRLTSASRESGVREAFEYDAAGNIASVVRRDPRHGQVKFQTRMLATGGRLEVVEDTRYFYDADGRLTEKWERGGKNVWKYEWSVEGRLTSVLRPNGERWRYEYDALGRRIRKTGPNGKTTEFLWDGAVLAEEVSADGPVTSWFYEPGTFRPVAKLENGTAYACVTDQVGTPKELVAADGTVAWAGQLTAFGEVDRIGVAKTDCRLRFQGQYFDEESGLHYNWHRYYEPGTGQYVSSDPIGLRGGTRSYGYVHNPCSWVDPWGLASCPPPASGNLDWSRANPRTGQTATDHVMEHASDIPTKPIQGVFADDPIATTNKAWDTAVQDGIQPTVQGNGNWAYDVPHPDAGLGGGVAGNAAGNPILNNVKIVTLPNTNTVVTAFPF